MLESIRIRSFWRRTLVVGFVWMGLALYVQPANAQVCVGDCDGDGGVAVNELVIGINIGSDLQPIGNCPSFGDAGIDDLLTGVGNALDGCPQCELADTSQILLNTQLGPIALFASGRMDVACGEGSERQCSCDIDELDPLSIPGVGVVCIAPAEGCPTGTYSCEGGTPLDVFLDGDRNIGECTGNDDCNTQCEAHCAAKGSTPTAGGRGCEGFCTDGNQSECLTDLDCIALGEGACSGPDQVPLGNICECQCLNRAVGDTSPAGSLSCMLGSDLVVETAAPCDGTDVIIVVGSQCIPLTSTIADGIIVNANGLPGNELLPAEDRNPGSPLACSHFDGGSLSGLNVRGQVGFFGSTIGDILSTVVVDCAGEAPPTATGAPPTATEAPPTATEAPPTATEAPPTPTVPPSLGERVFSIAPVAPTGTGLYPSLLNGVNAATSATEGPLVFVAGAPDGTGVAQLSLKEDVIVAMGQPIGVICMKLLAAGTVGTIDCDGGTPYDVIVTQESGETAPPATVQTGQGTDAGPGGATLMVMQQTLQLEIGADCFAADYSSAPMEAMYYTTANATATKGIKTITLAGENFSCDDWTVTDSAGRLASPAAAFNTAAGGDVGNITQLADN